MVGRKRLRVKRRAVGVILSAAKHLPCDALNDYNLQERNKRGSKRWRFWFEGEMMITPRLR
jgi:hypothetical protein